MTEDKSMEMHDELRPEYDLSALKGAVRGKYRNAGVNQFIETLDPETPVHTPTSSEYPTN